MSNEDILKIISKEVCEYYRQDIDIVCSRTRKREIVTTRQIIQYLANKYTFFSLNEIGLRIGNLDHCTILNSCKVVSNLIETNKSIRHDVILLKKLIENLIDFKKTQIEDFQEKINSINDVEELRRIIFEQQNMNYEKTETNIPAESNS